MQIPILSGIYTDGAGDFRTGYPINLVPVPKPTGIADGYLRPHDGIVQAGTGSGPDRGGIEWNGVMYRVMGSQFCRVASDGTVTDIGAVLGTETVQFDYGPTYLSVAAGGQLWLYNGTTLSRITDVDLGQVYSAVWIDGYYMATDGQYLIVTELNDPFFVNPLKYGSSEIDPDPVQCLLKLRNEIYALNSNTIEVFSNVGGDLFPFQRVNGGQIPKGAIGRRAACVYADAIAFLGGGRNEAPSVYIGNNGNAVKIATREIDEVLAGYSPAELAQAVLENRTDKGNDMLIIRLSGHTMVYDAAASAAIQQPVWFFLSSATNGDGPFYGGGPVWCYGKWWVGHPAQAKVGYYSDAVASHWGGEVGWQIVTPAFYNDGAGVLFRELELIALTGRAVFGDNPMVTLEYSNDGLEWAAPIIVEAGMFGQRAKRIVWRNAGRMRNWRVHRITGTSKTPISPIRLEAKVEPLAW